MSTRTVCLRNIRTAMWATCPAERFGEFYGEAKHSWMLERGFEIHDLRKALHKAAMQAVFRKRRKADKIYGTGAYMLIIDDVIPTGEGE